MRFAQAGSSSTAIYRSVDLRLRGGYGLGCALPSRFPREGGDPRGHQQAQLSDRSMDLRRIRENSADALVENLSSHSRDDRSTVGQVERK